jgi:hypothetical protein
MSHSVTVKNVPNAQVPQVKAGYEAEGATVTVSDNGDGTSNVTAVFPDSSASNVNAAAAHASAASAHASAASAHASAASAKAAASAPASAVSAKVKVARKKK